MPLSKTLVVGIDKRQPENKLDKHRDVDTSDSDVFEDVH